MTQCKDCPHFHRDAEGHIGFSCDPFANIREPECLQKWLLIKLETMVRAYQATLDQYQRLAPLQERMMQHLEREMDDMDEAERWKEGLNEDEEPDFSEGEEEEEDDEDERAY